MTKFLPDDVVVLSTTAMEASSNTSLVQLSDGGWTVTWLHDDGDYGELRMQRYDASGLQVGNEQMLGHMRNHAVTALADGGWLVEGMDLTSIPGHDAMWRFDSSGQRIDLYGSIDGGFDSVVGLPTGGWLGIGRADTGNGTQQLTVRRYAEDGQVVGTSTTLTPAGTLEHGDVVLLQDGGWVVTWTSALNAYQQRFAVDGSAIGPATQLSSGNAAADAAPELAALADGGWVAMFRQDLQMRIRRFDASGEEIGTTVIDPAKDGSQHAWTIEGLAGGGWVAVWGQEERTHPYSELTLRAQVFDQTGAPIGRPYIVDTVLAQKPSIEALDDGSFVVGWEEVHWSDNSEVKQRIFHPTESNALPMAIDDSAAMKEGGKIAINVLGNDRDADSGDILTLESATVLSGDATVEISDDGTLTVNHLKTDMVTGQTTKLVIEYSITDGFDTGSGVLSIKVAGKTNEGETVRGTGTDDRYRGVAAGEIYYGLTGNDIANSLGGDDFLFGGSGDDVLRGGNGNDVLVGGRGADKLLGGSGSDTFVFSPGDGRDIVEQHDWGLGTRDVLDLRAFGFESFKEVKQLTRTEGYDLIIDLPGRDRIDVIDAYDFPVYVAI